jgi:sugar phosphate isomerase/epimerase
VNEGEGPGVLERAGQLLRHVHLARPVTRGFPAEWDTSYDDLFAALRNAGYGHRVSIEAHSRDLAEEGPRALALVRRATIGATV